MTTKVSNLQPIDITVGVQPVTDRTRLSTPHYTNADKIRFWRGVPQKIGGWVSTAFKSGNLISGIARRLYGAVLGQMLTTVVGTHTRLYSVSGSVLTNITPLQTATVAIANSISTDYATLGANPVATTTGSTSLVITDGNASKYQTGDVYTLSGATTTNGVPDTEINAVHIIRVVGAGTVTIYSTTAATSTGSGGGASVVRATGRLTFAAVAHAQSNGDRTKILGAANTGGILAASINLEFVIRNVAANSFDVMTAGTATSSVTGGGGAGTTYQKQIAAGDENESYGAGYGGGLYGAGLYGVSKTFSSRDLPRTWFIDRFADTIIATPGNQTGVYEWDGLSTIAPTLVANAPTAVNYAFVSNNILVTFGAGGFENKIFSSDQNDIEQWTASSLNQVFEDNIEGAGRLLCHIPLSGTNLVFTAQQTFSLTYIGLPLIWNIQLVDNAIGIIGPMAGCSVNDTAYWMSRNNFFRWSGGNIEIVPANTQNQCTALNYVFGNINYAQQSKCFAWYNKIFNEVSFHYPSASSNECDRIVRVSLDDGVWSIDTMDRTCAEYPLNITYFPRLISSSGGFYTHETGSDADGVAMPFSLTSNMRSGGKNTTLAPGIVPDSIQDGTIQVLYSGYQFPQSASASFSESYDVTGTTERIATQVAGRFWTYNWSGNELGQNWIMGQWLEYVQPGASN